MNAMFKKIFKKYTFYILFSFVSNNVKLAFLDSVKKEILPTAAYLHFSDIQYPASQIRYPVGTGYDRMSGAQLLIKCR